LLHHKNVSLLSEHCWMFRDIETLSVFATSNYLCKLGHCRTWNSLKFSTLLLLFLIDATAFTNISALRSSYVCNCMCTVFGGLKMVLSQGTCNKIWQSQLRDFFTHEKSIINRNAGYDDKTFEDETTTILGLQSENIPWICTYHKICNLSWTCFKYIINIYECEYKLFTILHSETLWSTLISAMEVIPMSGNCSVFKIHTIFCALLCFYDWSNGNHNRCGLTT
jgi:hypothetical protein